MVGDLEGFDPWLRNQGLTVHPNDRVHEAIRVLRRADRVSQEGVRTGEYSDIQPQDWFLMAEAAEAHSVFMSFRNAVTPAFTATLKRALSGPDHPTKETAKNRDGRNVWYELWLAAEWKSHGANVTVAEPDLRLHREGMTFLVACKRVAGAGTIGQNIHDAVEQLQANLDKMSSATFGVVALNLTRVFNTGSGVFSGDFGDLKRHLTAYLKGHREDFRKIVDPRISCVMFDVATPSLGAAIVDMSRIYYATAWGFPHSAGAEAMKRHFEAMADSIEAKERQTY
jgi:hypothetical protein